MKTALSMLLLSLVTPSFAAEPIVAIPFEFTGHHTFIEVELQGENAFVPGLSLIRGSDGVVTIDEIVKGSPVAELGLARGDEIRSIGGLDARTTPLAGLRELLMEAGRTSSLVVIRGGSRRVVDLESRALVPG